MSEDFNRLTRQQLRVFEDEVEKDNEEYQIELKKWKAKYAKGEGKERE